MNVNDIAKCDWFIELAQEVREELARLVAPSLDPRPGLEQERQTLQASCKGWAQTLAKPDLADSIRTAIESEWEKAIDRQDAIDRLLVETGQRAKQVDELFDPQAVADRLDRLDEILAGDNATLGNLELSQHIDRIDCFQDGRVEIRICKLGLLGDGAQLLMDPDATTTAPSAPTGTHQVKPRRRARLRTEGAGQDSEGLKAAAYLAADPQRFAGLAEQWFWTEVLYPPAPAASWPETHGAEVFERRQEAKLSFGKLAAEFGVSRPTIATTLRQYLAAHPEAKDDVKLSVGGTRRPKVDVASFGVEARRLSEEGWSMLQLAEKFEHAPQTIEKAIAWAYQQEGLPVPVHKDRRHAKVYAARQLLDQGHALGEIAETLKLSDVTVRRYLRESLNAEGRSLPDLRRSQSAPP